MQKYFWLMVVSFLVLVSCDQVGRESASGMNNKPSVIMLPAGPYNIKTEADYQEAKRRCRSPNMHNSNQYDYCLDQLRWQRNYGSLKFLGEEKRYPIFSGY